MWPISLSILAFSIIRRPPDVPFRISRKFHHEETGVMTLSSSEDRMIEAWVILIQYQRVTDRRTDRLTDRRIYYSYCIVQCSMLTRCNKIRDIILQYSYKCSVNRCSCRARCWLRCVYFGKIGQMNWLIMNYNDHWQLFRMHARQNCLTCTFTAILYYLYSRR